MKKANDKPILKKEKHLSFMTVREYDCGRYFVIVNEIDGDVTVRLSTKDGLGPNGEIIPGGFASFDFPGGIIEEKFLENIKKNTDELQHWFACFRENGDVL